MRKGHGLRRGLAVAAACGLLAACACPAAAAGTRVIGTAHVTGAVESRLAGGTWRAFEGGALMERTELRTGEDGAAVVELTHGEVLGLAERSALTLGAVAPGTVRLGAGRLTLHLPRGAAFVVTVPQGVVRVDEADAQREALVTVAETSSELRVYRGRFAVAAPGHEPVTVEEGGVATLSADAPPRVAAAEAVGPASEADAVAPPARAGLRGALGLSPLGALLAGGGAVAVAGGVGAAAAAGAFSTGDGDEADDGPAGNQGSPFRPIRR